MNNILNTTETQDQDPGMVSFQLCETDPLTITVEEYTEIMREISEQPKWRATADKEMEYADGNQLDSELLRKMQQNGIPPAIENMIGPAMQALQGYESATRTDWRITPDADSQGQDVADAINYKLNQAERMSGADAACGDAFRPQAGIGIGWVEVSRNSDPFEFPYRCKAIHRNEIHWDMRGTEKSLDDARWLRRQRWLTGERIVSVFPDASDLVKQIGQHGPNWWADQLPYLDGGQSTGLSNAWAGARHWTVMEDRWFNPTNKELLLAELWYRRWVPGTVIKFSDGRVVEYDEANPAHVISVASGMAQPRRAVMAKVRRAYFLGPHLLYDGATPYSHSHFPYAPFWGFREDATGQPFGYIRDMIYPQDSLNSATAKLRWGMAAVRTERTKGAVSMSDQQFRQQVSRVDADIVLDDQAMARPGARFDVKRDYTLTEQHFKMLESNRESIGRVANVTPGFIGRPGTAKSGVQEQTQVEQSNQSLNNIMDKFRLGRTLVGEMLMSMIIDDLGSQETDITIPGDTVREEQVITVNKREIDPISNLPYLSNDLQRTRLKVALEDVPSSSSYRAQQLNAFSEAIKSLPPQYQAAVMPFMVTLMDIPYKQQVVDAIRDASDQQTPEQIQEQISQAVQAALVKSGADIKNRELDIKERQAEATTRLTTAQAVQVGVEAAFSAMQAGAQVASMPQIAPIADAVMKGAGYQQPNPAGDDPNFPVPEGMSAGAPLTPPVPGVHENTHPDFPPVPQKGPSPKTGMQTATPADNLPK